MKSWIIFDGDNTLWPIEELYDQARESLCLYLEGFGFNKQDIERYQQGRDKELFLNYGYSACRFARSFEDTILHFAPKAEPKDVRQVRSIAMQVFEEKPRIIKGLDRLLSDLSSR